MPAAVSLCGQCLENNHMPWIYGDYILNPTALCSCNCHKNKPNTENIHPTPVVEDNSNSQRSINRRGRVTRVNLDGTVYRWT